MTANKAETAALRAECERLLVAELDRVGIPEHLDRAVIVEAMAARGVPPSTCYRWIAGILASGRPGQHVARSVQAAVAARAARGVDPAAEAAAEVVAITPPVVGPHELLGLANTDAVLERLQACMTAAEQVMRYARTPEGAVRNVRGLLAASEHLRRTLETAVKLQESLLDLGQVERFHRAIFDVLRDESPEVAARIVRRMRALNSSVVEQFKREGNGHDRHVFG